MTDKFKVVDIARPENDVLKIGPDTAVPDNDRFS